MKSIFFFLLFFSQAVYGQKYFFGITKGDVPVYFYQGTTYASTTFAGNTEWVSSNHVDGFCTFNSGYLPASQAGYYYATVDTRDNTGGLACEGSIIYLLTADQSTCDPTNPWVAGVRFALYPFEGTSFYRAYDEVDGFTTLATTFQDGDKYGIFREAGGTVVAKYYRSGVWTTMHTYTITSTANLWAGTRGFYYSAIISPMASSNFVPSPPPIP